MTEPQQQPSAEELRDQNLTVLGPDGRPTWGPAPVADDSDESQRDLTELVEQPAKVMRIGAMIRQLLEEVKEAPLDEASRIRLKEIHEVSVKELESGLAPELIEELERLSLPFGDDAPSEAELRIAQAQLVGWLEGLFHGIQTAIYAQQVAARAQFEQMRRGLPPGSVIVQGPPAGAQVPEAPEQRRGDSGGMYL